MFSVRIVISSIVMLCLSQAVACESLLQSKSTERKAEILEHKLTNGNSGSPAPSEIITQPEAQALDSDGTAPIDDTFICLARTIYWEARGQETVALEAVASIVINRLNHEEFPNTICTVVKQGHEQGACQFSWWCDGRSDDAEAEKS